MGKNKYGKEFQKKSTSSVNQGGSPIKGGKIKASHILVDKLSKAQELYEDILAGGKLEDLAQKFSTCPSKKRGGNLGEFTKNDMVPEFWNACRNLNIGGISKPVKTKYGYHIIKRTG
ncbi:MAG: peptidylprolyl isomerase [Candidatus Lokiarchaeota archaeon]|nr:peptidylprolyl isomerase [Candidatus Lokiarchaeota archaeon]